VSRVRALAGTRKGAFVLTSDGKREDCRLRVYRSRTAGDDWEPLTRGLPRQHCYVNVLRDAVAIDTLDDCGVYFGTTGGQVYASGDTWAPIVRDLPAVLSVEATQLYFLTAVYVGPASWPESTFTCCPPAIRSPPVARGAVRTYCGRRRGGAATAHQARAAHQRRAGAVDPGRATGPVEPLVAVLE
jgi:hypothetical protein